MLTDIVSAMQAYITIDHYRLAKKRFYTNSLKKVTGYELNFIHYMNEVWSTCEQCSQKLLEKEEARNESAP